MSNAACIAAPAVAGADRLPSWCGTGHASTRKDLGQFCTFVEVVHPHLRDTCVSLLARADQRIAAGEPADRVADEVSQAVWRTLAPL